LNQETDIDSIFSKYYGRKKNESGFRNYLTDILNLFKELRKNSCEGDEIMLRFNKEFQEASNNKTKGS